MAMEKSIELINKRIREGNARVVTAEEMPGVVAELGEEGALAEVDVVTTGTFGAMCSTGAFLNFGHSDPPIRMSQVFLNDVEAYGGIAAVDAYIGATQLSTTRGMEYGGAHVLEDFVAGKRVELRALSRGTDCYPRRELTTELILEDLNQAIMVNPRNAYQRYNAATNSTDRTLQTYMGMLLPSYGNITYSGAGVLSPLSNDPSFHVIGSGVPIFLAGAPGMIIGEGTQHSPGKGFGTLMVTADMKEMSQEYLRAATMTGYGVTMYIGVGVPLPVIDLDVVRSTAVRDEDIRVNVIDYGVPSRDRPSIREISYADLKSGSIEIRGETVKTSSLSSFRRARGVALELKKWVESGRMTLSLPTRRIDATRLARPMRETARVPRVQDIMDRNIYSVSDGDEIREAAKRLLKGDTNHLVVLDKEGKLVGIITTYDLSKAIARPGRAKTVKDIMTTRVITTNPDEHVDIVARKLEHYNVSALPVIDPKGEVLGMLTAINLGKLFGGRWLK
jgi:uncharacterized protein (DUF39 family)/CBS domain-containing protein